MKINIHSKITLTFILILALVFSGIYLTLNTNLKKHTFHRIKDRLIKEAHLLKNSFEDNFPKGLSPKNIDSFANDAGEKLDLRVTIIDLEGHLLGDSKLDAIQLADAENHLYRPEIQQALSSKIGESRRYSATIKTEMLYIASVIGSKKPIAIIRLAIPLSEIELVSNNLKKILLISLIGAFGLAIIISFVVSIFISRPIKEISSVANAIAKGDFSRKTFIQTQDEIGELAHAFEYMTEQIELKIQEITVSKARLEAVLQSMFEGVMVIDKKGCILLMNQRLKNFLQVPENPVGKRPLEIIRNSSVQKIVDQSLESDQNVKSHEITLLAPDEKNLLIHASPIMQEGKPVGSVLVFHDITQLRHLETVRRDFVANVSHELRTPITSIKGYAETLLSGALEDKKNALNFLNIIYSDSKRMSVLIDDLLDLTRIESGKLKLTFEACEVAPLVAKVISGFEKQLQKNSITLKTNIPDKLPSILADENKITQVLENLIDNAIKYNSKEGTVTILAQEKNSTVEMKITDTGMGIPSTDIPRIFERFYRVDKARSRELGGTGLGLSIVKHIACAHKGSISVQSTMGQGSTFTVTLPKAG